MVGGRLIRALAARAHSQYRIDALRVARHPYSEYRNQLDDAAMRMVMAAVLRPNSCCVDIGAHQGAMLREMVRLAPEGKHIAFEPLSDYAATLAETFPTVDIRNIALGDRIGEAQFMRRSAAALSSLETVPEGEDPEVWRGPTNDGAQRMTVNVRRLDDELPDDFHPELIKIDVEGVEHAVLQGAYQNLTRHRPVVALEHSIGATHHGYPAGGIHDLLTAAGLRIFDADGNGPYERSELERTVLAGRMWFYFAFPS